MIAAKVLGMLFSYVFTVIIAKQFGVQALGNFSVALVFLNFFVILAVSGLDVSLVTYRWKERGVTEYPDSLFRYSLRHVITAGLLIVSLFFICINSPLRQIIHTDFSLLTVLVFGIIPLGVIRLQANYHRRMNNLTRFAFLNYLSTNVFAVLFLLILNKLSGSQLNLVWAFVGALAFTAIIGINPAVYFRKPSLSESVQTFRHKEVFSYTAPLMVYQLIENGYDWIVILLAGLFLPNEAVGITALLIKLSGILNFVDSGVNSAILNRMSEFYLAGKTRELAKLYRSSIRIILSSNVIIVAGGIVLVPFLFSYLGDSFKGAFVPLLLIFLAKILESYIAPLQSLLPVLQKQQLLMKLYIIRSVVLFISLIYFVQVFGVLGIAFAICFTAVIYVVTVMLLLKYKIRLAALSTAD